MAEYIDKKELIEGIKNTRLRLPHDSKDFFTRDNMLLNFEQIVSQMPTADVVEVVRCKDCKHFTKEMIAGGLEFICKSAEGMINPAPDKYCSCGTPKERGAGK